MRGVLAKNAVLEFLDFSLCFHRCSYTLCRLLAQIVVPGVFIAATLATNARYVFSLCRRRVRSHALAVAPWRTQTLYLALLVLQNASISLLTSYTRSAPAGTPLYLPSTVVVLVELLKLILCVFKVALDSRSSACSGASACKSSWWAHIKYEVITRNPLEFAQISVPAALYAVQNNVNFAALSRLDPPVYQLLYQLKVITTALFSVCLLRKSLGCLQWAALFMLFGGVVLVQVVASGSQHGCAAVVCARGACFHSCCASELAIRGVASC